MANLGISIIRRRKLVNQKTVVPVLKQIENNDDPNDEFANIEEVYKKNGSALAIKLDAKLKDDDVTKTVRKE